MLLQEEVEVFPVLSGRLDGYIQQGQPEIKPFYEALFCYLLPPSCLSWP